MKNNGFTLLEVVIAIGILVMVGAVAVGASTRAISVGTFVKNQIIAQNLARRQFEGLKTIRDRNLKNGQRWDKGLVDDHDQVKCLNGGHISVRGEEKENVFVCDELSEPLSESSDYTILVKLKKAKDDDNGPTGSASRVEGYSRELDESQNMLKATVTISWDESTLAGGNKKIEMQTYLTNDQSGS